MPLVIWINDWVSIFIFMLFFLSFFLFLLQSLKNHKATKQCLYFLVLYKAPIYKIQKNCTLSIQVASFQPETLSFNELAPFLLAAGFFIGSGGLFPFVFFFFMTAFGLAFAFAVVAGLFFALPLPLELPFPLLDHLVHLSHSVLVYLLYLLLYLFIFFLSSSWLTDRALNVPSELKAVCAELPQRNVGEVV